MCSQILSGGRTSQTGNTSETEIVPGGIHSNIERPAMCVQAPSSAASWTMTAIVAALASATPPYIQTSDRKYLHEILKCVTFSFKNINKWTESVFVKKYFKTYTSFLVPPLSRNFKIKYVSVHMNEIFLNSDFWIFENVFKVGWLDVCLCQTKTESEKPITENHFSN